MANLNLLRSLGRVEEFHKNQTVFSQNDIGRSMYIVLKGIFGVYINSFSDFPIRVAGIGQGSFFGEMSVIDGSPRSATVISEEDGAAIVIEKENFSLLLEKSPSICSSMMETLQNRAVVTAASFADIGREAPQLPPRIVSVKFKNTKSPLTVMTMLAHQIRRMDDLLGVPAEIPADFSLGPTNYSESPAPLPESSVGGIKLLPEEYAPFLITDINDNSSMLQSKQLSCPYCGMDLNAYIPLFSNLIQERENLDGRIVYKNFKVLWSNIVCPHCRYTDSYQIFSACQPTARNVPLYGKFEYAENFTGFAQTHKHTLDEVVLSYYQSLACLKETTANPLRFGKAWLRLFWIFSDYGPARLMQDAAGKARFYYNSFLEDKADRLVTDDKMRVNAILGELSAALGDNEKAIEYFEENTVICRQTSNELFKGSLERCKELKRLI